MRLLFYLVVLLCLPSTADTRRHVDDVLLVAEQLIPQLLCHYPLPFSQNNRNLCQFPQDGAGLKMFDASGKPGSNLLQVKQVGMWQWLGDYDECQDIGHDVAQYCLLEARNTVIHSFNSTLLPKISKANTTFVLPYLRWGFCVSRRCNASTLTATVTSSLSEIVAFNPNYTTVTCQPTDTHYNPTAIFVIFLCCFIGFLVLLATVVDYFGDCVETRCTLIQGTESSSSPSSSDSHEENVTMLGSINGLRRKSFPGVLLQMLLSFSLVQNIPKLLDTTVTAKSITCLHGIRTLSMMWVILGHCYFFYEVFLNIANLQEVLEYPLQFAFQAVCNAFSAVDSFFFLSGLLVMYLSLKQMDVTAGHFPWIKFYVHRFWRLTPTYAVGLLIFWQLLRYFADGPLWMTVYNNKFCDDYWWTNLLYINNFYPSYDKLCMGWTWFLAADTQMYVLSPLLILPAYLFNVLGLIPLVLELIAVFVVIVVIVSIKEFPANILQFRKSHSGGTTLEYENMVYIKFYTRAAPYLIGMALGCYLARRDVPNVKFSKVWALGGWILASAFGVTIVYGLYDYNNGHHYSQGASSLYLTFSSCLWGVCLAWVVYACTSGYGGIVDTILSWQGWFPLSRLTYSAYLLHPLILIVYIGSMRQTVFVDNLHMAYFFVSVTGLSYVFAAILSLCVEYPMAGIEKTFLRTVRV